METWKRFGWREETELLEIKHVTQWDRNTNENA